MIIGSCVNNAVNKKRVNFRNSRPLANFSDILFLIFIYTNSTVSQRHGIEDAALLLNHFASSLGDEYLTS